MNIIRRFQLISIVLIIFLLFPVMVGIFHQGFFVSDDGNWMVIRFSAFYQTFREGQFPVRFLDRLNYSYGYPVANFLYPGFMYLGLPLKAIGFNSLETVKILIAFFMIGGSVFSFYWLRKLFNSFSSVVGAVIYTYLPYHLYNLYKRGSVGELMSLLIIPFLLWMIERKSYFFTAIGFFFLLLSHNTLALLFTLLIFGYSVMRKRFVWTIKPLLVGGFLSSFFTIPAIFDLRFTKFSSTQISNPSENFASISLAGVATLVILVLTLVVLTLVYMRRRMPDKNRLAMAFVIILLFCLFLATPTSKIVWEHVPSSWVQFPFRVLSVALICSAFLASYATYYLFPKFRLLVGLFLLTITLIFSSAYLFPKNYSYQETGFYDTNESLTTTHDEYMPLTVKIPPSARPDNVVQTQDGTIAYSNVQQDSSEITFHADASTNGSVRINTIFFPGWNLKVDNGRKTLPFVRDDGLMYVPLLRGQHDVRISFRETPVRVVADALSILGLLLLCMGPSKIVINKFVK